MEPFHLLPHKDEFGMELTSPFVYAYSISIRYSLVHLILDFYCSQLGDFAVPNGNLPPQIVDQREVLCRCWLFEDVRLDKVLQVLKLLSSVEQLGR